MTACPASWMAVLASSGWVAVCGTSRCAFFAASRGGAVRRRALGSVVVLSQVLEAAGRVGHLVRRARLPAAFWFARSTSPLSREPAAEGVHRPIQRVHSDDNHACD